MSTVSGDAAQRKIIHIDMDAFYASVEQRDYPEYRGRPLIVGGSPEKRGVVATCSYEARKFGIHSAMPAAHAYRLCPDGIFIRPRFGVYREVSKQVQAVFRRYTRIIEPLSLDEAYLDVSSIRNFRGSATLIARDIKRAIHAETGLTASAGVSYNKFLAKIASDMDKPDGLFIVTPESGPELVAGLSVSKFFGVGKVTEKKMQSLGIHTGADLRQWTLEDLQDTFGKSAHYYYNAARGLDEREVISRRVRKSIGSETTFDRDLDDVAEMLEHLRNRATDVGRELAAKHLTGRTLTVKVKFDNFQQVTRSTSRETGFTTLREIKALLPELLAATEAGERRVRLLGVTVSNLMSSEQGGGVEQLRLL